MSRLDNPTRRLGGTFGQVTACPTLIILSNSALEGSLRMLIQSYWRYKHYGWLHLITDNLTLMRVFGQILQELLVKAIPPLICLDDSRNRTIKPLQENA